MNNNYTLEIFRNKSYRKLYSGKQSQCFKRVKYHTGKMRIKQDDKVIWQK